MNIEVGGFARPEFESVKEAMASNLRELGERGGSVCVYLHGEPVVDLWGGEATNGSAWQEDTMVPVFSVVKGATALVIQLLADRDLLDLDERIVTYWPEFAEQGKENATVKMIMCHTVGLPWFDEYPDVVSFDSDEGWSNIDEITSRLARQKPFWGPGSAYGYHSISFGWLAGEVAKRVTGKSIGTFFREEVGKPFGIDLWIGLPESEHRRVATLLVPVDHDPSTIFWADRTESSRRTMFIGPERRPPWEVANSPRYWAAEGPGAGGVGNARGIARLYGILANGGTLEGRDLVSRQSIEVHSAEHIVADVDRCHGRYGRLGYGFQLSRPGLTYFGPNDAAFGFTGFGGCIGFADPTAGIGFSYTRNQLRMESHAADVPLLALIHATYDSLRASDELIVS
jgi:CubicO group peptidase (beta-lactamase class C family)